MQDVFDHYGVQYLCDYIDTQEFDQFTPVRQSQAVCQTEDGEFVYIENRNGSFGLPGGTVEEGESLEETLERELMEEASVKVLKAWPLLVVRIVNPKTMEIYYQARYGTIVECLDQPITDPDQHVIARHLGTEQDVISRLGWGPKLDLYFRKFHETKK